MSRATSTPSRARPRASAQEAPPAVVAGPASRSWILPLLVFTLTVVPFLPSLDGRFLNWDDDKLLLNNPEFRGLGWAQLRWMCTTTLMGHWVPLTWLSLGLNYALGGLDPWGYHLLNVLLHAAAAVVVYWTARRLLAAAFPDARPDDTGMLSAGAAAAALAFGLHPLRVESVAWVTERRDVLSGLFFLLTVLANGAAATGSSCRC